MKFKTIILRSVQVLSVLAILSILSLGLVMPVSIVQGFIIHPLLFLVLIGSFTFAEIKIEDGHGKAELHQLPTTKHRFHFPCQKAA